MSYGSSLVDANGVPIGQTYTPGVGFASLQGSLVRNTDGSSNTSAPAAFHHASATVLTAGPAAVTTNFTSSALVVGPFAELAVDINITAKSGTSPTIQFFIDRIGADTVAYNIWSSAVVSTVSQVSASIGSGFSTNQSFGATCQFRMVVGGTTPSFTLSYSIIGK
jgi:hypothetical protein